MAAAPIADPGLLHDLATANRILAREGVLDAFGHVSLRHPERPDHYLISRSLGPAFVTEADLQRFTLLGEQMGGHPAAPYVERAIHGALYEARPDIVAVCHNHAPSTIPFGITDVALQPVFHMAALLGTNVPKWDIADEFGETDLLVRTIEQGRSLARALGPRRAVLMRGHGSTVVGASLRQVVIACVYMEQSARLQMQALTLAGGTPKYLSTEEARLAAGQVLDSAVVQERSWDAWRRRAGMGA
jgi:ribulose-5-phosphate 4-epimerase/fuculose-1-phosphate aldolase